MSSVLQILEVAGFIPGADSYVLDLSTREVSQKLFVTDFLTAGLPETNSNLFDICLETSSLQTGPGDYRVYGFKLSVEDVLAFAVAQMSRTLSAEQSISPNLGFEHDGNFIRDPFSDMRHSELRTRQISPGKHLLEPMLEEWVKPYQAWRTEIAEMIKAGDLGPLRVSGQSS
ncbi:hypothetical protein [Thalassospira xiamenensis]|uniref:Uncharacterized protein n=1 Tax=Thalassospira xiamenensis TaxID=220697 RepID=A0A285TVM7_9PROT|nr:hypothetical protein [Thalassospira xiamenensis]SOC26132.1 hypothetical protein SAMN05428964_10559 [Thalassospira xiamenensis]